MQNFGINTARDLGEKQYLLLVAEIVNQCRIDELSQKSSLKTIIQRSKNQTKTTIC